MAANKAAVIFNGLAALLIGCVAEAQTTPEHNFANTAVVSQPDVWRFVATPYIFLPLRTEGQATVADTTVDVDLNLKKTLELLNTAFSVRLEAWKGRFGLVSDLYYVHLNLNEGTTVAPPRNPQLDINIDIDVNVDVHQGWIAAFGVYRVLQGHFNESDRRYFWDIGAGVRWNRLRQEVKARVGIDIGRMPEVQNRLGGRKSWWEPTIGTRVGFALNDCLTLGARTEIGGFGAGGDDLQWNVLAGLDWRAWKTTSLRLGYQYYSIDYSGRLSDGRFAYDITEHGPYLAVTWRW
ncbi:hypothetical protein [uncultured Microbulbifer sp.]|uniref:hypothetical protein n=1 Tax=uncultured Microbulbifer sp. TaxID=348147 RepID=UPI00261B8A1B|nr:hypothetical protein [uncultured Microbulbifer sp.]